MKGGCTKYLVSTKKNFNKLDLMFWQLSKICDPPSKSCPYLFPDNPLCPLTLYNFYTKKLNPKCPELWQKPRTGHIFYTQDIWYEGRIVGHDKLDHFMTFLSRDLELSQKCTNHCICSTCITLLNKSGFEGCHIVAISGHKSEATIKSYSVKCPTNKKKEMFDALSKVAAPMKKNTTETVLKPLENNSQELSLEAFDPMQNDDEIFTRFLEQNPGILDTVPTTETALVNKENVTPLQDPMTLNISLLYPKKMCRRAPSTILSPCQWY